MEIDFQDQTNSLTVKQIDLMEKILHFAAKREAVDDTAEMSVNFVNNEMIRQLNQTYRNKNEPTDVISFALQDPIEGEVHIIGDDLPLILGDLIISVERAKEQAEAYDHTFERELAFLAVHGFFHLLGYNHIEEADEKIMFAKQKNILDEYGLER